VRIHTIGFQGKTAEEFFEALKSASIKSLIDVRLRNDSHLAGFARRVHLEYFLEEICGAEHVHELLRYHGSQEAQLAIIPLKNH
jgi:uncharacterized protein (DUF488 family)